ncbi:MAG TPA: serine/threonine-protein kinase [Bacteroidota bacterium]|nr:serine/threonine-protein kinase [Bacteroidota bacterium]
MDPMIGKMIDSYKILEVLGRGGMGVVYRATDTTLDRDVALKMMDVLIASDPNFLKRFQSEAKALAKLQNPNIVSIFALRQTEYGVCIVMEFVKGRTLADLLKQSVLIPVPRVVHIFKQLLTALDHAHKGGVIHRDIKPGNVMLAEADVVKVTDFGLAKIQKTNVSTVTMGTAGTLYYMSPEQIRGLGQVDARGDIYSAGMALYECLTGRVPFKAEDSDFAVAQMIVEGRIPPPEKLNASIPKELAKIVTKSIDKDPAKRYQTAAEMVTALERFEGTIRGADYRSADAPTIVGPAGMGPLTKPKPAAAQPNLKLYGIIGAAVVVLIVTYFLVRPSVFPDEGTLSVQAVPESGIVFLDNQAVKSPVSDFALATGKHHVTVTWGRAQRDTAFTIEAGKSLSLRLVQPATAARQTTTESTSQQNPPPGLTDEKKGPPVTTEEKKEPVTTAPVREANADITLEAVPDGQVKVDDGPWRGAAGGIHVSVSPGQHQVVFRSGSLSKSDVIDAKAGGADGRKCYFQGSVNITSVYNGTTTWASIVVDGATRDETTPKEIMLPAGTHTIAVQKNGYSCTPAARDVTIPVSLLKVPAIPAKFELKKK